MELPYSKEAEMIILSCIINQKEAQIICFQQLLLSDFYFDLHKTLFLFLKKMNNLGSLIAPNLVIEELKKTNQLNNVGGLNYLLTIFAYAGTSSCIISYCNLLKNKSYVRQIISLLEDAKKNLLNQPEKFEQLLEKYCNQLLFFTTQQKSTPVTSIKKILHNVECGNLLKALEDRQTFCLKNQNSYCEGLLTGYLDIDSKAIFLEKSNLIIIAGRPAMGKTALVLNILTNICFSQNQSVAFISLEMNANRLTERILSIRTGISGEALKKGTFSYNDLKQIKIASSHYQCDKFLICDQPDSLFSTIVKQAKIFKKEQDICLLAIDYLQLLDIEETTQNRQFEVAGISRKLKKLAIDLEIPIIVIAQLSRKVEERTNKIPIMSDLRDSGQIEQDADAILLLYRKDYYSMKEKINCKETEVILSKNRHGPTFSSKLYFDTTNGQFNSIIKKPPLPHQY